MFENTESENKTKYDTFYSHWKLKAFTNESDMDHVFTAFYTIILLKIYKSLGKGSGWIIDWVIDHKNWYFTYNPLASTSYIKLPKELDHPRKGLINVQIFDVNECFKWCFVR